MRKIAAAIERADGEVDVSVREVDGDTIYVVSDPEMAEGPSLEFGVVDDQAVVGTGGGIEDLVTEPTASLADDPQFQAVMDVLPSEYYQVAYVNIGQVVGSPRWPAQWRSAIWRGRCRNARPSRGQPGEHPRSGGSLLPRGEAAGSSVILYIAEPQS